MGRAIIVAMDEKGILFLILGAVISADVVALLIQNTLFEKRFKRFEHELAHNLERDLIGYKWSHDKKRSVEEELLLLVETADHAVQDFYYIQIRLPSVGRKTREVIVDSGFDQIRKLDKF